MLVYNISMYLKIPIIIISSSEQLLFLVSHFYWSTVDLQYYVTSGIQWSDSVLPLPLSLPYVCAMSIYVYILFLY